MKMDIGSTHWITNFEQQEILSQKNEVETDEDPGLQPVAFTYMCMYTHKHIRIYYIYTCTCTKVQTESQELGPKLICAWASKGRYSMAPEKVTLEETREAHMFQKPVKSLLHSSEDRTEVPQVGDR